MRVNTQELLHGGYGQYALGAFNVCNLEQIHGLFQGAARARAPVTTGAEAPPRMGAPTKGYPPIEPAPGSYVMHN